MGGGWEGVRRGLGGSLGLCRPAAHTSFLKLLHDLGSDNYYPGGYIVETHGSLNGGLTDAICLETPREVRIDKGKPTRDKFGRALADAIAEYISTYYEGISIISVDEVSSVSHTRSEIWLFSTLFYILAACNY